jgi:Uma2 family endonuclease
LPRPTTPTLTASIATYDNKRHGWDAARIKAMGTTTLLTFEEFCNLPEEPGKQELLDGELISLPPAKLTHMRAAMSFLDLLRSVLPKARVWIETGYRLRRGWLIPDVSVSRPDQRIEDGWMQGAPMLAIEIVSPSNRPDHIDRKTAAYLEEGAAEVWVLYPTTPSMSIFRKGSWERVTETYHSDLFGITIFGQVAAVVAE